MNYTSEVIKVNRWSESINFGSPMTAWTPEMFKALKDNNGDKNAAMDALRKRKKP